MINRNYEFFNVHEVNINSVAFLFPSQHFDGLVEAAEEVVEVKKRKKRVNKTDPYKITVYGVGYRGEGPYCSESKFYKTWSGMLDRVYGGRLCKYKRFASYSECLVGDDFKCLNTFGMWAETQKGSTQKDRNGKNFCLDYDILITGNKVYTANACCFVPQEINVFFSKSAKAKGYTKVKETYRAQIVIDGVPMKLGRFKSEDEASRAYQAARKERIKQLAYKYQAQLDDYVFDWLTFGYWKEEKEPIVIH